jgi:hypothetical protein
MQEAWGLRAYFHDVRYVKEECRQQEYTQAIVSDIMRLAWADD